MFHYSLLHLPSFDINTETLDEIFKNISEIVPEAQGWQVNIVFVEPYRIKNLNKEYRKKDSITDVLSFHYYEDFSKLEKNDTAGEIVLCEEKILSQGKEYQLGSEKEFYKLIIHATLHLLWYDHENDSDYEVMKALEEKVWQAIFLESK